MCSRVALFRALAFQASIICELCRAEVYSNGGVHAYTIFCICPSAADERKRVNLD